MKRTGPSHICPWPTCTRVVPDPHWGCIEHWGYIPTRLQIDWRVNVKPGADVQSTAGELAIAQISDWVAQNAGDINGGVGFTLRKSDQSDFCAGLTVEGKLFLLWPNRGEFFTLTREESVVVVRAIRAMYSGAV